MRTLGGIMTAGGTPDVTQLGWPTLRAGLPLMSFLGAMREMRAAVARRSPAGAMPVIAVIGAGASQDRSIAALNVALAAARDGARVLMIDADHAARALSGKVNVVRNSEPSSFGWLSIGTKASRAIKTVNGISVLPAIKGADAKGATAKAADAIRKAIAQARAAGGYDLVVLDGPAMPLAGSDLRLLDVANGLIAILPANLDINDCMEDIIAALDGAERKLVGVVLNELTPAAVDRQRGKQYA
jgi:Mrp family chromosome partitioning ATPase